MLHALLFVGVALSTSPAQEPVSSEDAAKLLGESQRELVQLAKHVTPSVVTVRTYVRRTSKDVQPIATSGWLAVPENQDYVGYRLAASGSGFVVDAGGEILTCANILARKDGTLPDLIDVETSDGARILCDFVGSEPTVNIAILRCSVFPAGHSRKLPALRFGDSDSMECGMWAVGVGDPAGPEKWFGIGSFVTKPSRDCYQDLMSAFYAQVALTAPPGAYGGPLVDLRGDVIGVLAPRDGSPGSTGTEPRYGLELALPSKIVEGLYATIRQVKSSRSPWLGFSVMGRPEIAAARGVEAFEALKKPTTGILIENVFQPSPAHEAGLRPGDFLVGFDAYKVFTPVDFQRYLYLAGIGTEVALHVFRDGAMLTVKLVIQERPAEARPR